MACNTCEGTLTLCVLITVLELIGWSNLKFCPHDIIQIFTNLLIFHLALFILTHLKPCNFGYPTNFVVFRNLKSSLLEMIMIKSIVTYPR